ncbi:hypothetical protein KFU94_04460 [Chloroflexi bacterium TSY]|nr:hypothetical protein [Chloroflexi bacterium TSY]
MDTANRTYSIYVFQDPAYHTPLVLATVMALQAETIYLFGSTGSQVNPLWFRYDSATQPALAIFNFVNPLNS